MVFMLYMEGVEGYVRHGYSWELNSYNTNNAWLTTRSSEVPVDGNTLTNTTAWPAYNFSISLASPPSSLQTPTTSPEGRGELLSEIEKYLSSLSSFSSLHPIEEEKEVQRLRELLRYHTNSSSSPPTSTADKLNGWITAEVPGTVLTNLVVNGYLPDPYYDLNSLLIPDIFDTGVEYYTFWYYLNFSFPYSQFNSTRGGGGGYPFIAHRYFLHLRGINYRADVYFNGHKLNNNTLVGMFRYYSFDLSPFLPSTPSFSLLALQIQPPNPPGNGTEGQCGDGRIAESVTCQYMAGWDWIQSTRDRSTGIWDKIELYATGKARIISTHLQPRVPGVRSPSGDQEPAYLNVTVEVENLFPSSLSSLVCLHLYHPSHTPATALPLQQTCQPISLPPSSSLIVSFGELMITTPLIWWPNGYGPQPLYSADIFVAVEGEGEGGYDLSDQTLVRVGLRDLSSSLNPSLSSARQFAVNGNEIFIRGGNWIGLDSMFRLTKSSSFPSSSPPPTVEYLYEQEVRMHAEMNLNLIRVWGGGITERPEFYDACDRYGLLVWQEFWITGDCNGQWNDSLKADSQSRRRAYPNEHSLFLLSSSEAIKMVRNHPSLLLWVGGNEYPPPEDLDIGLALLVQTLDPNRLYLPSSLSGGIGPFDGPYNINDPKWFFYSRDPNVFNPEMGSVGTPTVETMRRIMKEEHLQPFGELNRVWEHHKYIAYYSAPTVPSQIDMYGVPSSIDQFCLRAQLANYVQYKALYEGRVNRMWEWYTGIMVWKSQNPWTGLRGQFYDWYGEQLGSFYGTKSANEAVHVLFDLADRRVTLVNHHLSPLLNFTVHYSLFQLTPNGSSVQLNHSSLCLCDSSSLQANSVLRCCFIPDLPSIHFITLLLSTPSSSPSSPLLFELNKNENTRKYCDINPPSLAPPVICDVEGVEIVSKNFYWIGADNNDDGFDDFLLLQNLSSPIVSVVISEVVVVGSYFQLQVTLTNNSTLSEGFLAFFLRLQILYSSSSMDQVLPVYYEDNYFSLLPEEVRTLTVSFLYRFGPSQPPILKVSGWNLPASYHQIDR